MSMLGGKPVKPINVQESFKLAIYKYRNEPGYCRTLIMENFPDVNHLECIAFRGLSHIIFFPYKCMIQRNAKLENYKKKDEAQDFGYIFTIQVSDIQVVNILP